MPRRRTPPPWDAVLFDLDGTLANTLPLILTCFRHAMEVHRPEQPLDDRLILENVGRTLDDTMRLVAPDPEEAAAIRATYLERQLELHDEMVTPFVGALTQVERFVRAEVPIAIVTSKGRLMTERTMRICALDPHFEHLITADDVTRGKPDPQPVHLALERLGVRASDRVAFIGDSPHDIHSGRAAGVRTIAVTWGAAGSDLLAQAEPDHTLQQFWELEEVERGMLTGA